MIKIESTERGSRSIITVAGELDSEHLEELERHRDAAGTAAVLDLRWLQEADEAAIRWLRAFVDQGGLLTRVSPYVRVKLERVHGEQSREKATDASPR